MRLNPGLHVVPLEADGAVQIGTGPAAVRLSDAEGRIRALLDVLGQGVPDGQEIAAASRCGLPGPHAAAVLEELRGVLVPLSGPVDLSPGHARDLLADDVASAWARRAGDGAGEDRPEDSSPDRLVGERAASTVQVVGLGRTGASVAQVLAAAGIGQLLLHDPHPVSVADLGTLYRSADLGRVRAVALSRRLDPDERGLLAWPGGAGAAELQGDLTVAVTRGFLDRDLLAAARAADHPVLPVVARDQDVVIGPWLDADRTGCPECWQLAEVGPADHPLPAADAGSSAAYVPPLHAGWEETSVAAAAGALAAAWVLDRVDAPPVSRTPRGSEGHRPTLLQFTGAGRVDRLAVDPHPQCSCAWAGVLASP